MIKKLFFLFIFFAPFTSFFALSAWLRVPVVLNQLLFVFLILSILIYGKVKNKWILKEDILIITLYILVWLSFLFGFREQRSFNHSLAYTNCIIFYFFVSKYVIQILGIKAIEIASVIYKSFIVCSIIILIDFFAINFYDFSLRRIYSPVVDYAVSNMSYYIRGGLKRVGGVAEEPGSMANFYNIYFGLSLFYVHQKKNNKIKWILSLFILSHFALYSSAGIALSIGALIFIFMFNKLNKLSISKKQLYWIVVLSLTSMVAISILLFKRTTSNFEQIEELVEKITFNEKPYDGTNITSSGQRLYQWSRALSNFIKHPIFGSGPGFGVDEDPEGYLSVYLTILSDIGILALMCFILFQIVMILKVNKLKGNIRNYLFFSVFTSFLHLIIIADFYQAPVWILFVMIQLIYTENKLEAA